MNFLTIPERTKKERRYGVTSIMDLGIPIGTLKHILDDFSDIIDFAKIGIGTAYVAPKLAEKIQLYKSCNVKPYLGGTFFEKCYAQNELANFERELDKLGIEWVEISSGTLDIPLHKRIELIHYFKKHFYCLGEAGSKDSNKKMSAPEWKSEINELLAAGCKYVITEGRDSGTSGIYHQNGQIKTDLIRLFNEELDVKRIIFEAPTPKHQMYFIKEIGPNVNLGNIKPDDVLLLEAERCALRSETFFLEEKHAHYINPPSPDRMEQAKAFTR